MPWKFEDDFLWYSPEGEEEKYGRVCQRVEVIATHIDILTGLESVEIQIARGYDSEPVHLPSSVLTTKKILEVLCGYGLKIVDGDESAKIVKRVLLSTQQEAPVIFEHSESGFRDVAGHQVFLGYKAYGHTDKSICSSTSTEKKTFEPRGSPKVWRKLLLKYASKKPMLALVLGMGISATVAHVLKTEGVFKEVLIWALVGDSSIGKSCLLLWISSIFGSDSLIQSCDTTTGALGRILQERPGVTVIIDDASYTPETFDWDSLIYSTVRGRIKRRLKGDGSLRPLEEFSGALVMASERSVLSRTLQLPGERSRLLEFREDFFESGEEAEEISNICARNFGWGTEPLMTLLLSEGFSKKLVKKYRFFYKKLLAETTQRNGQDRRLLQRFSILLVSVWLAQKAFKVDMHLDNCITHLKNFYTSLSEENAADPVEEKLLSDIAAEIARNNARFPEESDVRNNKKAYSSQGIDGLKGHSGNTRCVWISETVFKPMFSKFCKDDLVSVCKKMHAKGYMEKFYGNRFYKEKSLVVGRPRCYCLLFPDDERITDIIDKLNQTQKTTVLDVVKAIHNDPYGLFIDKADVDNMTIAKSAGELMKLSFEKLGAQDLRMTLNKELYTALHLSTSERVYLLPVPSKGILLLSKKELIEKCFFTRMHLMSDGVAYSDVRALKNIFDNFDLPLNLYEKLELTDIAIEMINESPVAVINMINDRCTRISAISGNSTDLNDINFKDDDNGALLKSKGASNINYLLSEDPEDEE